MCAWVSAWVCAWVCAGLLQVCRPYTLFHSASLRSFASPVNSDGYATPLFLVMFGLSSGYAVVEGGGGEGGGGPP